MPDSSNRLKDSASQLFAHADVAFNGDRPWDIQVHNDTVYSRILSGGSIGLGEAYIDDWWDCEELDVLFDKVTSAQLSSKLGGVAKLDIVWRLLLDALLNRQTLGRAYQVGEAHYDIGNDLFEAVLDPSMNYSCAYWNTSDNLQQAQTDKMDLICRKLKLDPGMRVLDIGCGWGGLAEHMIRNFDVSVVGLTISKEQKALAETRLNGLPAEIFLEDYRLLKDAQGFDRVVSVGMFEHVGNKNYQIYFQKVAELLKPEGLFLLHTIGTESLLKTTDGFIQKYIFPNGKIPNRRHINDASLQRLRLEDWHNFGNDYDRTLMAWFHNFEAAWPELKKNYDHRFYRMWRYYLCCCAGWFRSRQGQLWQLVYTKPESSEPYRSVR